MFPKSAPFFWPYSVLLFTKCILKNKLIYSIRFIYKNKRDHLEMENQYHLPKIESNLKNKHSENQNNLYN